MESELSHVLGSSPGSPGWPVPSHPRGRPAQSPGGKTNLVQGGARSLGHQEASSPQRSQALTMSWCMGRYNGLAVQLDGCQVMSWMNGWYVLRPGMISYLLGKWIVTSMSCGPCRPVGVLAWSTGRTAVTVKGPAPSSGYELGTEPGSVVCCPHHAGVSLGLLSLTQCAPLGGVWFLPQAGRSGAQCPGQRMSWVRGPIW